MIRTTLAALGFVLAAGSAQAQSQPVFDWGGMPPLTIEMVRQDVALGMAPTVTDVENLRKCPDMRPGEPMDMTTPEYIAQAQAQHINLGVLWLKINDAAIARCLAGVSAR
jgi:hypothetical protein